MHPASHMQDFKLHTTGIDMENENTDFDYEDFRYAKQQEMLARVSESMKLLREDSHTTNAVVFASELRKEHRTHQANVIRFMLYVLKDYSDAPHDLRNERPVEICNIIKNLYEKENLYIPYI